MIINKNYIICQTSDLIKNIYNTHHHNVNRDFSRVCYVIQLQSKKYKNQWIITEFDALNLSMTDHLIPSTIILKSKVNNLSIQSSYGVSVENIDNGHIEFSPFNYSPGENGLFNSQDGLT